VRETQCLATRKQHRGVGEANWVTDGPAVSQSCTVGLAEKNSSRRSRIYRSLVRRSLMRNARREMDTVTRSRPDIRMVPRTVTNPDDCAERHTQTPKEIERERDGHEESEERNNVARIGLRLPCPAAGQWSVRGQSPIENLVTCSVNTRRYQACSSSNPRVIQSQRH